MRKQHVSCIETPWRRSAFPRPPAPPSSTRPPPYACKQGVYKRGVGLQTLFACPLPLSRVPRLCAPAGAPVAPPCSPRVLGGGTLSPLPCGGFAPPRLCMQTGNAGRHAKGTSPPSLPSHPRSLSLRPLLCTDGTPRLRGPRVGAARPPSPSPAHAREPSTRTGSTPPPPLLCPVPTPAYALRGRRDGPPRGRRGKGPPAPRCRTAPSALLPHLALPSPPFACAQFKGDPTGRGVHTGGMRWGGAAGMGEGAREVGHARAPSHQRHGGSPFACGGGTQTKGRAGMEGRAPSLPAPGGGAQERWGVCSPGGRPPSPALHPRPSLRAPIGTPACTPPWPPPCSPRIPGWSTPFPLLRGRFAPPPSACKRGTRGGVQKVRPPLHPPALAHLNRTADAGLPFEPRRRLCMDRTPCLGVRCLCGTTPPSCVHLLT
jgi:hypothetical protein